MISEFSAIVIGELLINRAKRVRSVEYTELRPLSLRKVRANSGAGTSSSSIVEAPAVSLGTERPEAA